LANSITFQLFSYFFRIDVTLGVISVSAHILKWYTLVWYNLIIKHWGW
jgi:hypothetical protein